MTQKQWITTIRLPSLESLTRPSNDCCTKNKMNYATPFFDLELSSFILLYLIILLRLLVQVLLLIFGMINGVLLLL